MEQLVKQGRKTVAQLSATITVTSDDPEDFARVLAAIGSSLLPPAEPSHPGMNVRPARAEPSAADWYRAHGVEFSRQLQTNARKALVLIVERGPVVPIDLVAKELGVRGPGLAGSLASIGATCKRLGAPEPPFKANARRREYTMSHDVQAALAGALA